LKFQSGVDPATPPEERAQRRGRLTKGPPEFREDRSICRKQLTRADLPI
jgi:hypothetical protein